MVQSEKVAATEKTRILQEADKVRTATTDIVFDTMTKLILVFLSSAWATRCL